MRQAYSNVVLYLCLWLTFGVSLLRGENRAEMKQAIVHLQDDGQAILTLTLRAG